MFHKSGGERVGDTHVFRGLQVDDGDFPAFALGEERKVAAGFDLHGGAERQRQVRSSGCRQNRNISDNSHSHVQLLMTVWYRLFSHI